MESLEIGGDAGQCGGEAPIDTDNGKQTTDNGIKPDELFYEIGFRLNKAGVNPDDMELDEVYWILKKINEEYSEQLTIDN